MANISFDYSNSVIFKNEETSFRKYTFRDIGTDNIKSYKNHSTGELKIIDVDTSNYDETAIRQSLINLFNFRPGEEILLPLFGNELYRYLYEPTTVFAADKISKTLKNMLERWEPRIRVIDTPIEVRESDHSYCIQIKYSIPLLQQEYSITLNLNNNQVSVI